MTGSDTGPKVTVATFNCEWRRPTSSDAAVIRERVSRADVVCLTETHEGFLGPRGHLLEADSHFRANAPSRRKVTLWSREPWSDLVIGSGALADRYVAGTTQTVLGPIRVHGIVIPYRFEGVRYGDPRKKAWQAHLAFLRELGEILRDEQPMTVVMGDFNQRVPRKYQPQHVFEALEEAVLNRLNLATPGLIEPVGKQAIDHICHSPELRSSPGRGLSNLSPSGREISDHFGVEVELGQAGP